MVVRDVVISRAAAPWVSVRDNLVVQMDCADNNIKKFVNTTANKASEA